MPAARAEAPQRDLTPADAAYLDKVRRATSRLATREVAPDDVRAALQAARDVASFNVEVPTASPHREVQLAKQAVKRAAAWYLRYLAEQVNAFAGAAVRLGEALVNRLESAEATLAELTARVQALEGRAQPSARLAAGATPASAEVAQPSARQRSARPPSARSAKPAATQPKPAQPAATPAAGTGRVRAKAPGAARAKAPAPRPARRGAGQGGAH